MFPDVLNSALIDNNLLHQLSKSESVPDGTDSVSIAKSLMGYIDNFQKSLDDEHEVGIQLANFGRDILFQVEKISFEYPSLMVFYGYVGNQKSTLVQHVNQLNFLLISVPKEPERPKRIIGFSIPEE